MAPKRSIKNTHPATSSDEEEDEELREKGAVEEGEKEESSVKDRESLSDPDDESENTAPSPNVSDFIIKPIVSGSPSTTKPSSKRSAESDPSETPAKKERVKTPTVVLALSKQSNYSKKKLAFKGKEKTSKLKEKTVTEGSDKIDSKPLVELLREHMLKSGMGHGLAALDVGMRVMKEKMGGGRQSEKEKEIGKKWRKLQQQMLELYINRLELVQEQTKLVLHELVSLKR
ncbi:DNA-binding storekeeper protein-related transcriptional regulator [Melia azedarach]|uniref:DNA-binding storekeeper protein-related transcriptional regulator n=1 Tax=Melia azedarach TaxID=155640 RepID=A0ACC1Z2X1_MELAZ|nr:DNA-binding storekeeper protein-related transcriptional regulator [Melia azedarach]